MRISIVIPARNEEEVVGETIEQFLGRTPPAVEEVIVVDDHSTDGTAGVVRALAVRFPAVRLVANEREPGFANALLTGFEKATGDFILPVMADGCDDPATVALMREKALRGYDLVCGSRYRRGGGKVGGPFMQGCFSFLVGTTLPVFAGLPTRDVSNAYKLYRREMLDRMRLKEKGFAISMEAVLVARDLGYRIADVPTVWYGRKKGKSKFRFAKTLPYVRLYCTAIVLRRIGRSGT